MFSTGLEPMGSVATHGKPMVLTCSKYVNIIGDMGNIWVYFQLLVLDQWETYGLFKKEVLVM